MTSSPNIPANPTPTPTPTPDTTPPTSTITSPTAGATVLIGTQVAITGAASDTGGGSVVRVEVSVDGGATWNPAIGTNTWSFNWMPSAPGQATIKTRAVDNAGNIQNPPAEITVTVRVPITIRVPSDQPTIQAAINVATFGDTVLVAPGTYRENINFGGKAITVRSESGPQVTVIDGRNADPVVIFTSGEGRGSVLNGFTLQNGRRDQDEGGGIRIRGSSPKITNNVIRNNQACFGGGIGIGFGSPLVQLNTITGNTSGGNAVCDGLGGGGISIQGDSSAEILDNVISDNVSSNGGGILMFAAGTPIIKRNIIKGNTASNGQRQGGGIYIFTQATQTVNQSDALIVQNLITGNKAAAGGGISWSLPSTARGPILVNNTIADNNAQSSSGIYASGFDARTELTNNIIVAKPGQTALSCGAREQLIIRFNNIFSSGGMAYDGSCSDRTGTEGNISADPLFANPTLGDYHPQLLSPSIDAGDNRAPNLPDTDLDGDPRILDGDGNGTATIDMGVDEVLLPPGFTWPISIIRSPVGGATVLTGTTVSITGLARDAGGATVARVEVSVDGGVTWSAATGTTAWSYDWTPATPGPATIKSRAVANSGNVQNPPAEITVTVRTPIIIRVPSEQLTIQAAINVATFGDTVLVAPGTYRENINFFGKAITVRSESGPQGTIIDGRNADSVVIFTSEEGRGSVLNGFTLQNGRRDQGGGGGIRIQDSSPKITNNVITNNQACGGGGISIISGSPLIQLNTITSNRTIEACGGSGGGISVGGNSSEILDNVISDNTSPNGNGGGITISARNPIIKRNIIERNNAAGSGGGLYMQISSGLIVQNLITGNQGRSGAGLFLLLPPGAAHGPILVNNTIADNNATFSNDTIFIDGDGIELINNIIVAKPGQNALRCGLLEPNTPIMRFNNIFSSGGMAYGRNCPDKTGTDGNISADPQFTNPAQGDYHLQQVSPSIDAGDNLTPNLPDTDIDGGPRILDGDGNGTATIDMGVDEFLLPPGSTTPISTITSPKAGVTVPAGTTVSITGLARDAGGGTVDRVEVSVDGGATWTLATGTTAWSFDWTPTTPGPTTIKSRAVDDSGNTQDPPAEITVTVRIPVDIRVPSEQLTIQAAINVAQIGDTVLVAPGTYSENIKFKGKAITVRSESGPQGTIINGGNANPVVTFNLGEGRDSVLNGFTLQNGRGVDGGGISVQNSSPTITNNEIRSNQACSGGGISIHIGSPLIQRNKITGNTSSVNDLCLSAVGVGGGGISISGRGGEFPADSAEILDNVISDNSGGSGIAMGRAGTPIIKRNIIKGNTSIGGGGGIAFTGETDALIVQNLITGNQASAGGGIAWALPDTVVGPILVNNTIADNNATSSMGSGIFADAFDGTTELTNNIIVAKPGQTALFWGPGGQNQAIIRFNNIFSDGGMAYGGTCSDRTGTDGNISADPKFINPTQGDYHLQQGSPSIDAGANQASNLPDTDIDGDSRILDGDGNGTATVDIGVDEFLPPPSSNISLQDESNGNRKRSKRRSARSAPTSQTLTLIRVAQDDGQFHNIWGYFARAIRRRY
jgi:hypothetical protein